MAFLTKEYGPDVALEWQKENIPKGFRLVVDGENFYDWSLGGRFRQMKDSLKELRAAVPTCPPGAGGRAQLDAEGYGGGTGDRGLRGGTVLPPSPDWTMWSTARFCCLPTASGHGPGPAGE